MKTRKYAIVIPDGCADEPQDCLEGRTPLQAARTPAMDSVAHDGLMGRACHVPARLPAGSAVANMSLLGYDPLCHFSGRAPLEAAAQRIELGRDDWAVRCNLVTIEDQIMRDFTADHISTPEARLLLQAVQEMVPETPWEFHTGVSYRNLLIYRGTGVPAPFSQDTRCTPPHDLTGRGIADEYPRGPGSDVLAQLMAQSADRFAEHGVNVDRRASGRLPATCIWLWGLGRQPDLAAFSSVYGRRGLMITAVDLLRGLAQLIGWTVQEVPGATGYTDTDYAAKGRAAIEALDGTDLVCVHVEATDEASHEGDVEAKIKALESIDHDIVAPLHEALKEYDEYRLMITPDHPTPVRTKTHSHGDVPFAMAGTGCEPDSATTYDERSGATSALAFDHGWKLMRYFLEGLD